MAIKIGINGFGRIGRNVLRTAIDDPNFDFVAVNDLTSPQTLAHLLKYDSILGNLKHDIKATGDAITINGRTVKVFSEKDPAQINWASVVLYQLNRSLSVIGFQHGVPTRPQDVAG